MFNPFKKSKKAPVNTSAIEQLLSAKTLYGKLLTDFIQSQHQHDDVLDISITIGKTDDQKELETLYHPLQKELFELGVAELNFNVQLSDDSKPKDSVQSYTPKPQNTMKQEKSAPKQQDLSPHPRIKHTLAIASGKGGVGKSTTTANLALALQKLGYKVGILDADIYGPSMPDMLGVAGVRPQVENENFVPIDAHGIAMLSIGSLLDGDSTPVAWRGVKATGALMQLYGQTNWPNLDYLLIDMPPGTGDIALTLAQRIAVTGAVVITTPQHIALLDAKKGVEMFQKTDIPVIGIVENMALHTCSNCGHSEAIFGTGGADEMTAQYGVPLLGRLPLDASIRQNADRGTPSVLANDSCAVHYMDIAKAIDGHIGKFIKVRDDKRIF